VLGARQFPGELNLLNAREALVSAQAKTDMHAIRLPRLTFYRLTAAEPDIAEIIMRALILRRVGIVSYGYGPVPGTASSTWRTTTASRAKASTMRRPESRPSSARRRR
jgi:thioredoxin reductase (NADPH)